jgi:putative membrane protein
MFLFSTINPADIVSTIVFTTLGVGLMAVCWWILTKISPFPVLHEIEHDQNVALAVLIGSVFLSLAIIIAAVILS